MTPQDRAAVRKEYATGDVSRSTLAARYGVSTSAIDRAVKGIPRPGGQRWRDLTRHGRPGPLTPPTEVGP